MASQRDAQPGTVTWVDTPFGRRAFVADPYGAAFCLMDPIKLPGS